MDETERRVRRRARNRCEYCLLPQSASKLRHQIDHIIAKQHGRKSSMSNLALACVRCNLHKGPNIAGIDRMTGELVRLFDPRRDRWRDHFMLSDASVLGLTPTGRTTVQILAVNEPARISIREALQDETRFSQDQM